MYLCCFYLHNHIMCIYRICIHTMCIPTICIHTTCIHTICIRRIYIHTICKIFTQSVLCEILDIYKNYNVKNYLGHGKQFSVIYNKEGVRVACVPQVARLKNLICKKLLF